MFIKLGGYFTLYKDQVWRVGGNRDTGRSSETATCSVPVQEILLEGTCRVYSVVCKMSSFQIGKLRNYPAKWSTRLVSTCLTRYPFSFPVSLAPSICSHGTSALEVT